MEQGSGDTIAAVATATGRGAVGIVRVSGPAAVAIAVAVLGSLPVARVATRAVFADAVGGCLDDGLVLYFPGPRSYTGDDMVEFQGHGSPVILASMLDRCVQLGARLAEPGEFTKRAFLNGKLALSAAEAVADIIEASSMEAARAAVRALRGELNLQVKHIDRRLLDLRALLETALDFPDDYPDVAVGERLRRDIVDLTVEVRRVLGGAQRGRLLRDGVSVVLLGSVNVGKSSLFNCLTGGEIAIVTDTPGTTRDILRAEFCIEGVLFRLLDTAGVRESSDRVEQIGIQRARAAACSADVVVLVSDNECGAEDSERYDLAWNTMNAAIVRVRNKSDLRQAEFVCDGDEVAVSALTGYGIANLRVRLLEAAGWRLGDGGDVVFAAQARHVVSLERALMCLVAGADADPGSPELVADELRQAHDALGEILGRTLPDDLLGEIFARFCIGK